MMQKKTVVELGIIAVLAGALILASLSLVKRTGPVSNPQTSKKPGTVSLPKTADKLENLRSSIKIRRIKDDNFFVRLSRVADALPLDRDPFSFGGAGPRSSRDHLELAGILWDVNNPTAIIDEGFYKAGDSTERFTVVKILENKVILKDSTGEFELRLKS